MEREELRQGKKRVQEFLIGRLTQRGMIRPSNRSAAKLEEMKTRLEARLAYMTEAGLIELAETVAAWADGARKDRWPAEISIVNKAETIEKCPSSDSQLIRTYIESGAGTRAKSEGYLVELYSYLKKFGHYGRPNHFAFTQIKQTAEENARRRDRLEERTAAGGMLDPHDRDWLARYWATFQRCEAIIQAKIEREAKDEKTASDNARGSRLVFKSRRAAIDA